MLDSAPQLEGSPPEPLGEDMLSHWQLDPAIAFLNHGCFGAAPEEVLAAQAAWQRRLETRPIELLDRRRDALLAAAKEAVGRFVGAAPEDFGFVTNATGGVNAVLRSLRFGPGDDLVTTTHVYNAVRKTMQHVARESGARYVEAELRVPVSGPGEVVEQVTAALTERTRLLVIDHVTSPTAIVLPLKQIVAGCADRGIDVLVDGAHAPGMLELDVAALGAAYYTGNLHKWVCAPKGAAFLWARPDRRQGIHPNTISHFLDEGLAAEFAWQGTRDITPWLCAADAIAFMDRFGWARVRRHNHQLAVWVQALLARRLGAAPTTPLDGSMLGSMATVELPVSARQRFDAPESLQAALYDEHRIEVPIIDWDGRWWIRASCQIYNEPSQYERLAETMTSLLHIG